MVRRTRVKFIGEHAQRHLGAHVLQPLHQEVRRAHSRRDGAEGMLDGLAAVARLLRMLVEAAHEYASDLGEAILIRKSEDIKARLGFLLTKKAVDPSISASEGMNP